MKELCDEVKRQRIMNLTHINELKRELEKSQERIQQMGEENGRLEEEILRC